MPSRLEKIRSLERRKADRGFKSRKSWKRKRGRYNSRDLCVCARYEINVADSVDQRSFDVSFNYVSNNSHIG